MLRRQARLRREYIYRKSIEARDRTIAEKKQRVKNSLEDNTDLPTALRKDAIDIEKTLGWDDEGGDGLTTHVDDEYRWAGVEDPKIMVTTSHDPSSKLKQFAKEIRLIFPNSQRINRGNYEIKQLVEACRSNDVTDLIILHEHRGVPDGMIISHLPYGPTAYFTLLNCVMRHDIPDVGTMSEVYPHLIFHRFTSKLGQRLMTLHWDELDELIPMKGHKLWMERKNLNIIQADLVKNVLKYLFPVAKEESKRILTFANDEDHISFRHHTYKRDKNEITLNEVGPRFEMKLYKLILGTIDTEDSADVEWVFRPYMNTTKKRKFLSSE